MSGVLARSAAAEEDLVAIWLYIAKDSPAAADRVLGILDERSRLLAENPCIGPRRDDISQGLRCFPVGNCLILCRETGSGIEAVRYVHGMRDLSELL